MAQLDPAVYTVAWIAPLEIEARAALHMLDHQHDGRFPLSRGDDYVFRAGDICGHNVIIATLPAGQEYGSGSAAALASQVRKFFPNLWFGLLVGVAAGLPNLSRDPPTDIRLGDVLVGLDQGESAGLIAYDLGKETGDFQLLRGGRVLAATETVVRSAIGSIKLDQPDDAKRILQYYESIEHKAHANGTFFDPGQGRDQLYHFGDDGSRSVIEREERREDQRTRVWYGSIGSGEKLMKNARKRNELRDKYDLIGLEMEAAGTMNRIAVGVIRGVCDYGDEMKNKEWQPYASAMAASYAKAVLHEIPPKSISTELVTSKTMTPEENECLNRLFVTNPEEDRNFLKLKKGSRTPGTCDWIFDTQEFKMWLSQIDGNPPFQPNFLWLHGLPGIGKSTMAIALTEELPSRHLSSNHGTLAYFFCDSNSETQNTATSILRTLIYQFIKQHPTLVRFLKHKYEEQKDVLLKSFVALWAIFLDIAKDNATGQKYVIIDAIDECNPESREIFLKQLNQTFYGHSSDVSNLHVLIISRPYQEIEEELQTFNNKDLRSFDKASHDIKKFIQQKVDHLTTKKRYTPKVAAEISQILTRKAEGTFLWVGIACEELSRVSSNKAVKLLQNLPRGLHSVYEKLLDLALRQDDTEEEIIMRILSFVAVSQRPLSLLELSVICQLHHDQDEAERLAFMRDDVQSCRLMVVMQDDRVSLLHKSIKDFLTDGKHQYVIDELAVHRDFAYQCLDYVNCRFNVGRERGIRASNDTFFEYSVQYWGHHAQLAEEKFEVAGSRKSFFALNSECRQRWVEEYNKQIYYDERIGENSSILHIAARWGLLSVIKYVVTTEQCPLHGIKSDENEWSLEFIENEFVTTHGVTPLEESARFGTATIITFLLRLDKGVAEIKRRVILAAAENQKNGKEVMTLLLHQRGDQITITEDVITAAAGNEGNGKEVMTLLLNQRGDQIIITEDVVKAAAGNWINGEEVMTLLLSQRGDQIIITEDVIMAAAGNRGNGKEVMTLLLTQCEDHMIVIGRLECTIANRFDKDLMILFLNQCRDQIIITEDVVKAAARNLENGKEVMTVLLNQCGSQSIITEDVVKAAAGNWKSGKDVIMLLLSQCGDQIIITEDVVMVAAGNEGNGEEVMSLLLHQWGGQITITEDVITAAAGNWKNGKEVITLLLDQCGDQIIITEDVVMAAAGNEGNGKEVMTLLLHRCGDQIIITKDVIIAAAGNWKSGKEVMKLLLNERGDQITITEEVVCTIANRFDKEVMTLLLSQRGDQITITEDIVTAAAGNEQSGEEVMTLLFNQRGYQITITEDIVTAAVRNEGNGEEVMALLLNQRGDQITITEDMITAAAGNEGSGKKVIALLLNRRGNRMTVTEEVVCTIANRFDKDVMTLLLSQCGNQITITEGVVKAAARNGWYDKEVMSLLLHHCVEQTTITDEVVCTVANKFDKDVMTLLLSQCGDQVIITEDVVMAAAGNWKSGKEVMTLLLNERGDQITITEEVVCTIANRFDKDVMTLLLSQRGDQITITEDIVTAAAGNEGSGKKVLALLLSQRGDQITITEDIVMAAAGNEGSGKKVIALLLSQRGDQITITEDIVMAAAGNEGSGKKVMALLLSQRGDQITITEDIVMAAAGNEGNGEEVMALLLSQRGDQITITEDIVMAAAGNEGNGEEVIALLLSQRGDQITITEDIITAAAGNEGNGEEVIALLLSQRGDQITITEDIVMAAAGNEGSGKKVMALLLSQRGDQITITEDIITAAAGNEGNGEEVMALLLSQRGDQITITEDIAMAAAGNEGSGEEVMSLLLSQRRGQIAITEDVIKAAAGNWIYGKEVMTLLLNQCRDQMIITEDVVKAAVGNELQGHKVIAFLHQRFSTLSGLITDDVLYAAASCGQGATLKYASQALNVHVADSLYRIALFYNAAKGGNIGIVDRLLRQGINPDTKDPSGETPLWNAADGGHQTVVHILLQTGSVNVDSSNIFGQTPVFPAAAKGFTVIVRLLLEARANTKLVDKYGSTAYSLAKDNGHSTIIKLLEDY